MVEMLPGTALISKAFQPEATQVILATGGAEPHSF
jgi:hypothetical protein